MSGSGFVQALSLLHMNIPWHTAGVELLQQQQINGRSSEQTVNGNCCMHGQGSPCSKYHCFEKWVRLMNQTLQWQPLL